MFTETWTNEKSDLEFDNFTYFILNRTENKKSSKRNSGGIVIYIKNKYVTDDTLVSTSSDDIIWVKLNGTVFSLTCDLYICLTYVLPDDSSRQAMIETNIFDRLLESIVMIDNKCQNECMMVVCGDMNSRTSDKCDYVIDDSSTHMHMLPDDYVLDTEMPRFSQDKGHTNNNGLLLLDMCKQSSLRIINGRFGEDQGFGRYTFVGSRGSSVVDYVLSSQNLLSFIDTFSISEPNILSDHCNLSFSLNFTKNEPMTCKNAKIPEKVKYKFVWDKQKAPNFTEELNSQNVLDKLSMLNNNIDHCVDNCDIDACVNNFNDIIENVSKPYFKRNVKSDKFYNDEDIPCFQSKRENPWFNDDCQESKLYFLKMLNKYRVDKTDINRVNMVKARSAYKTLIRTCRTKYDREITNTFNDAKYKNAKLYWRMLKETAGLKPCDIPLSSFEQYFKAVNNPDDPFFTTDEDILYFKERYEQNEFNVMFEELNVSFTEHEVYKAINQTEERAAQGGRRVTIVLIITVCCCCPRHYM